MLYPGRCERPSASEAGRVKTARLGRRRPGCCGKPDRRGPAQVSESGPRGRQTSCRAFFRYQLAAIRAGNSRYRPKMRYPSPHATFTRSRRRCAGGKAPEFAFWILNTKTGQAATWSTRWGGRVRTAHERLAVGLKARAAILHIVLRGRPGSSSTPKMLRPLLRPAGLRRSHNNVPFSQITLHFKS